MYNVGDMAALLLAVIYDIESRKKIGAYFSAELLNYDDKNGYRSAQVHMKKADTAEKKMVAVIKAAGRISWILDDKKNALVEESGTSPAEIENRTVKIACIIARGGGPTQKPQAGYEASQRLAEWTREERPVQPD